MIRLWNEVSMSRCLGYRQQKIFALKSIERLVVCSPTLAFRAIRKELSSS
jgi:hypothetical protein